MSDRCNMGVGCDEAGVCYAAATGHPEQCPLEPERPPIPCPLCDGDGGWESAPYGYNHVDGSPITSWVKCHACDGRGEIEDDSVLIEEDDLPQDFDCEFSTDPVMNAALKADAEKLEAMGIDPLSGQPLEAASQSDEAATRSETKRRDLA